MENAVPKASWKERALRLVGLLRAIKIEGNSMAPVINSGDIVLFVPRSYTPFSKSYVSISIGDIVLARHPYMGSIKLLKRVREIDSAGKLFLAGDNEAESTDSRTLGWFAPKEIEGRVVCQLK